MAIRNAGYDFALARLHLQVGGSAPIVLAAPWPAALAFGSIAAYVLLVAWATSTTWWRARARGLEKAHYAGLCVYSAACFLAAAFELVASGEGADFVAWLASQDPARAPPRLYCSPMSSSLRLVSLSFIASKVWEWGDTLMLIAGGKSLGDIGGLHLYHHATTVFLFLFVSSFPVTEKSGLLLNAAVHALMYYHFAFRLPRFLRPLLTGAQIVQLVVVTYAWVDCARVCDEAIAYKRDFLLDFAAPFLTVPVYTVLFVKFFFEQYVFKKGGAEGDKVAKKEKAL
jgi:hypothetical protein